jgi:hypothetical protein
MRATNRFWFLVAAAMLWAMPGFAQTLQINNPPSNNVLDGIYVGSYSATNVNTGGSVQITCDDFKDDSNYNKATYTTNTFSNLGNAIWGSGNLNLYEQAAWLTLGTLSNTGTTQAYYSYATWAVFDGIDVANWFTKYGDSAACNQVFGTGAWSGSTCSSKVLAGGLLALVEGQSLSASEFSNVLILTPTCTNGPGTCQEQEFLTVVAEGGSALMYMLLAAISCFAAIFFRFRQHAHPTRVA